MSDATLQKFRQECKHYSEYLNQRDELLKKLYLTQVQINGVHSIDTAKPRNERYEEKSVLLKIEAKDRILKNLYEVNKKIRYIEDIIRNVNYPFYRVVIWDKYIMNKSYRMITHTYGVDVENLRKHVNKELQRAIQVYNSDSAEALKK